MNICYVVKGQQYYQLTLKSIDLIKMFYRGDKSKLRFYIIYDQLVMDHDHIILQFDHHMKSLPLMHVRHHIPHILRKHDSTINRYLYLDSDVLATTCVERLLNLDLQGYPVGAVSHYQLKTLKSALDFYNLTEELVTGDDSRDFFNAGVMLVDIDTWLESDLTSACDGIYARYIKHQHYKKDEPFINIVLRDNWLSLEDKWNYYPRDKFKINRLLHQYGNYTNEKPRHNEF